MKKARPRVIANFAITADGKTSTRNFTPTGFTGPRDLDHLRKIRSLGDALLVGANTVAHDHMSMGLSSRSLQRERMNRGQSAEPLRVIVSNRGNVSPDWKVLHSGSAPRVIFSTRKMPAKTRNTLAPLADLWLFESAAVDLPAALAILRREYGVRTLVCEGGPSLFRSLMEIGAVDELRLTWSPKVFGGAKAPTITSVPEKFLSKTARGRLADFQIVEGECFLTYRFSGR